MPFTKAVKGPHKGKYRSPSGNLFTPKQVRHYYANKGFQDGGPFDPFGKGYDKRTFNELVKLFGKKSMVADVYHPELGRYVEHGPSLDPRTGMVLKGRGKYNEWNPMVQTEMGLGSTVEYDPDRGRFFVKPMGMYSSVPADKTRVEGFQKGDTVNDQRSTLLDLLTGGKYQTSEDIPPLIPEGRPSPEDLTKRREAILPYLEFATGIPALGEREQTPSLMNLALTAPVIGGAGLGAYKLGKDIYKRATTVPVWRGVTQPVKTIMSKRPAGSVGAGEWIQGSPLYSKALHTSMNPKIGLNYAVNPSYGGVPGTGQLLKFNVPKKLFREHGVLGQFQPQAEEVIFRSGLPKSFMQYAKRPEQLTALDKLENYLYSFGRGKPLSQLSKEEIGKLKDIRLKRAEGLEKKFGMKRQFPGDEEFYTPESGIRFDADKLTEFIDRTYGG